MRFYSRCPSGRSEYSCIHWDWIIVYRNGLGYRSATDLFHGWSDSYVTFLCRVSSSSAQCPDIVVRTCGGHCYQLRAYPVRSVVLIESWADCWTCPIAFFCPFTWRPCVTNRSLARRFSSSKFRSLITVNGECHWCGHFLLWSYSPWIHTVLNRFQGSSAGWAMLPWQTNAASTSRFHPVWPLRDCWVVIVPWWLATIYQ